MDIEDYCDSGFIGLNSQDISLYGDWTAAKIYYSQTSIAFRKGINAWYDATIINLNPITCQRCIQLKADLDFTFTGDTRFTEFWDNADNNNMVDLTYEQYYNYKQAIFEQICIFKNLVNCLDGDFPVT